MMKKVEAIIITGSVRGPRTADEIDNFFRKRDLLQKDEWKLERTSCTHFGIFSRPDEYIICAVYERL